MARPKQDEEQIREMREQFMDEAIELLKERGPEALNVRSIAERVGVSHMVLYTYFENYDAFIEALSKRQIGRMQARQAEVLKKAKTGDVKGAMREALAIYARCAQERPQLYRFGWVLPLTIPEVFAGQRKRLESNLSHLSHMIQLGIQWGVFVDQDPFLAAATIICIVNSPLILYHSGRMPDPALRDQVEEEVLQIAMDYLCNGRSEPIRKDTAEDN